MTTQELIAKFNPADVASLTEADMEIMRGLNDEQINALAEAYPNEPQRRAYLILWDDNVPPQKQLFQPSTWQNLRNVRKFAGKTNLRPHTFMTRLQARRPASTRTAAPVPTRRMTVDLSPEEAAAQLKQSISTLPNSQNTMNVQNVTPQATTDPKAGTSDPTKTKTTPKGGRTAGGRFAKASTETETPGEVLPEDQEFADIDGESE